MMESDLPENPLRKSKVTITFCHLLFLTPLYYIGSSKDVRSAHTDVHDVIKAIKECRDDSDTYSGLVSKMEALYNGPLETPRLAGRQSQRQNHQAKSPEDYYLLAFFLPYIDYLVADMEKRFECSPTLAKGMDVLSIIENLHSHRQQV